MSAKHYDYLILGNSTAGTAAIEAIRQVDPTGSLAVVSDQTNHVYSSPLITYVLAGKIAEEKLYTRARDFYQTLNCDTYFGAAVTQIKPAEHEVVLANGAVLGYGKLLIAMGGVPIVPPLPGVDLQGVFSFTRHDDMVRVREYLQRHNVTQAVVVGGGMIGIKVAEAFSYLKLDTTVVELADRVLALALDDTGSTMAKRAMEQNGVRVITGSGVTSIPVTAGGSNQFVPGAVKIVRNVADTTGIGATATAVVDPATGVMTSIRITNPGTDYTLPPTVTLDRGQGTAATLGTVAIGANSYTGGLTKKGAGTLTLTGANTYSGDTVVEEGTLALSSAYLADTADVKLAATGAVLNLNTGATDTIRAFFIGGVGQFAGEWGPTGSGAEHESGLITGTGRLLVTTGGAPSAYY
ncbi:MAG: FAD-dependent oxidoreductase, partial [Armatimonadota bacterium]